MQRSYVLLGVSITQHFRSVVITRHILDVVVTRRSRYVAYPVHGNYSTFQILGLSDLRLYPLLDVSRAPMVCLTLTATVIMRVVFWLVETV
jgi:hypothetical protein